MYSPPHVTQTSLSPSVRLLRARGLSLVETLVVMSILAVLLSLSVPNMSQFFASNRLNSATSDFFAALNVARSEAMRRGASITLRHNGTAGSRDWSNGWTMFVDANGNGTRDTDEDIVRQGPALSAPVTMFANSAFATTVTFDSGGRLTPSAGGVFVVCDGADLVANGEARSRALVVNASGRVRQGVDSNGDRVPETDAAAVASCTNP